MNTAEQLLARRVMNRVSVLTVYASILGLLVACADSPTGASDSDTTPSAIGAAATENSISVGDPARTYSDVVTHVPAVTDCFVGEVLGETIRVSWKADPDATGYNIYRQGKYYSTVFDTEFQDTDIQVQDYRYEIKAFEKNGSGTRFYTIADGLIISVTPEPVSQTVFVSPTTDCFVAEVLDDSIRVTWSEDPDATGYNIYRQGKYHSTVFETEFYDADIAARNYSYEIKAFEKNGTGTRYYSIADDLIVAVQPEPVIEAAYPSKTDGVTGEVTGIVTGIVTAEVTAEVPEDSIRISWKEDPNATGYNVYRQGEYYTTVFKTEFYDVDAGSQDYEYEIIAFEKNGANTRYYSITDGLSVSAPPKPVEVEYFKSATTDGFVGEVLNDSIQVRWKVDPDASGYNVFRQGQYYKTVFTNQIVDSEVYDHNYYYEIQAFEHGTNKSGTRYYTIATGLTVSPRSLGKKDPTREKSNASLLKDYNLVFSDEFNDYSLDASKWNTSFLWGTDLVINSEEQYYVDILKNPEFGFNPFTFDGSHLTINTIKTPARLANKSLNQPYLSGIITSYDAFKFTYGYAEVRARMTHGRGYWPAFWLLNAYYGGDDPEIDIMEFIGDNQDVVYHTFHYYDANGKLRSSKSEPTVGIDYTSGFHTFSVEWKPGSIVYFVDGIEAHRITDPNVPNEQMYLIANTAVGGWWAGSPDELTPFPGRYVIDYIRVYQKNTLYNDSLFNDEMTDIPYADDVPNQSLPGHRPTQDQWPEIYPYY